LLVVDDVADSATTLASLLDLIGHEARAVFDPFAAMEEFDRFAPDAVILDIGLPSMNGYELARVLRDRRPEVSLFALTGYGQSRDRDAAADAGFDYHLVKPVDFNELERLLASVPATTR
jgi:CheY-like chemotaxis protein